MQQNLLRKTLPLLLTLTMLLSMLPTAVWATEADSTTVSLPITEETAVEETIENAAEESAADADAPAAGESETAQETESAETPAEVETAQEELSAEVPTEAAAEAAQETSSAEVAPAAVLAAETDEATLLAAVVATDADGNEYDSLASAVEALADAAADAPITIVSDIAFAEETTLTLGQYVRFVIASDVAISGPVTFDGQDAARILPVFSVSGKLTLSDGVTIQNAVSSGTTDGGYGAAIRVNSGKELVLDGVTIKNCVNARGAVYSNNASAKLTITNCLFEGNGANLHGGGALYGYSSATSGCKMTVSDTVFKNNTSTTSGGAAMFVGATGEHVFTDCTFTGNSAEESGGAIYVKNGAVTLDGVTMESNTVGGAANDVDVANGTLALSGAVDIAAISLAEGKTVTLNEALTLAGDSPIVIDGVAGASVLSGDQVGAYYTCFAASSSDLMVASNGMLVPVGSVAMVGSTAYAALSDAIAAANAAAEDATVVLLSDDTLSGEGELSVGASDHKVTITNGGTVDITVTNEALSLAICGEVEITGANGTALIFDGAGSTARSASAFIVDGSAAKLTLGEGAAVKNMNYAGGSGAAICAKNSGTVTIAGAALSSNTAAMGYGGAIFLASGAVLEVSSGTFTGNSAAYGGVLYQNNSAVQTTLSGASIEDILFEGNSAVAEDGSDTYGGAIFIRNGSCVVNNVTFKNNSADYGGAAAQRAIDVTYTNVSMTGNTAALGGGAMFVSNAAVKIGDNFTTTNTIYLSKSGTGTLTLGGENINIAKLVVPAGRKVTLDGAVSGSIKLDPRGAYGDTIIENSGDVNYFGTSYDSFSITGTANSGCVINPRTGMLLTEQQNLVVEMGYALYEKASYTQYQQTRISGGSLSNMEKLRVQRREPYVTPGELSYQRYGFLDCSSFVWATYNNVFGDFTDRFYPQTGELMTLAEAANTAGEISSDGVYVYYKELTDEDRADYAAFVAEIEALLQPGDLINYRRADSGHVLLYVGNGYTIEATGGDYDYVNGVDTWEDAGSLKLRATADYLLNPAGGTGSLCKSTVLKVMIMRPLNMEGLTPTAQAQAYADSSGISVSKTALRRGQSVEAGEEITYTITLENMPAHGMAYDQTLYVSDPLSENVTFVSATDGGKLSGGAVTFTVKLGANAAKSVSYTVRVNDGATGKAEGTVGNANGIEFKCADVTIGTGLSAEQEETLIAALDETKASDISALSWLNGIYASVIGADFGVSTDDELFGAIFTALGKTAKHADTGESYALHKVDVDATVSGVAGALVDNITGGYGVLSQSLDEHKTRVRYLDEEMLKVGDVLATVDAGGSYAYYVYRGSDMLKVTDSGAESAATASVLDGALKLSRFALLRPSLLSTQYSAVLSGATGESTVSYGQDYTFTITDYDSTTTYAVKALVNGAEVPVTQSGEVCTVAGGYVTGSLVITVTDTNGYFVQVGSDLFMTLEEALEDAESRGKAADVILLDDLTYTEETVLTLNGLSRLFVPSGSDITISGPLTLQGNGADATVMMFYVNGGTLTLDGVTMKDYNNVGTTNNNSYGWIRVDSSGSLYLKNAVIDNCDSQRGVYATSSGAYVEATDTTFKNCDSRTYGGAVGLYGKAEFKAVNCRFENNSSVSHGGAIANIDSTSSGAKVTIDGCTFVGNVSGTNGGAITLRDAGSATISGTVFTGNSAAAAGGAVRLTSGAMTLASVTFEGNTAAGAANAVDAAAGTLTLEGTVTGATVTLTDGTIAPGASFDTANAVVLDGVTAGQTVLSGDYAADYAANFTVADSVTLVVGTDGVVYARVAQFGGVKYSSVAAAVDAAYASGGGTVKLIESGETVTEETVSVKSGVTLDLSGQTLACSYLVGYDGSHVIDSSADKSGVLLCERGNVALSAANAALPIWNGTDGYLFEDITKINTLGSAAEGTYTYVFRPEFSTQTVEQLVGADGGAAHGVTVKLRLSWDETDSVSGERTLTFTDDLTKQVYGGNKAFYAWITNYAGYVEKNLKIQVSIVSDLGVEIASEAETVAKDDDELGVGSGVGENLFG